MVASNDAVVSYSPSRHSMLTRLIAVFLLALAFSPCTAPFQTVRADVDRVRLTPTPVEWSNTLRATGDPRSADQFKGTSAPFLVVGFTSSPASISALALWRSARLLHHTAHRPELVTTLRL
jgi:hypothetical protein